MSPLGTAPAHDSPRPCLKYADLGAGRGPRTRPPDSPTLMRWRSRGVQGIATRTVSSAATAWRGVAWTQWWRAAEQRRSAPLDLVKQQTRRLLARVRGRPLLGARIEQRASSERALGGKEAPLGRLGDEHDPVATRRLGRALLAVGACQAHHRATGAHLRDRCGDGGVEARP